jgi:hypothetical protein
MSAITITSPKVIAFFAKYPDQSPNDVVESVIDIFELVSRTIGHNADKSAVLSHIQLLQNSMSEVKSTLSHNELKTDLLIKTVDNINQWITTTFFEKFQLIKSEYLQDTRTVLQNHTRDTHTLTQTVLEKYHSMMIRDTENLLRSIIHPDVFDKITTNITSILLSLHSKLQQDTNVILQQFIKHDDYKLKIEHFIDSYKSDLDHFSSTILQPINTITSQSTDIQQTLSDFLIRYNCPSDKGKSGENELSHVLNRLFPSYEITNTTGSTASGDFIIHRKPLSSILIETKEYSSNVPSKEVDKFIRDTELKNISGIFLSQSTGIVNKPNWGVDIFGSHCRIYVHNVRYNPDIIQSAIDLLDTIEQRIVNQNTQNLPNQPYLSLNEETANRVSEEVSAFLLKRNQLIIQLEANNKQSIATLRELGMPTITNLIQRTIGDKNSIIEYFPCEGCHKRFESRVALGSHYKGCKDLTPELRDRLIKPPTKSSRKSKKLSPSSPSSIQDKESE